MNGEPTANRYRIEGKLTTTSPLHVGCGRSVDTLRRRKDGKPILAAGIDRDARDLPVIPGSAIKGVVSEWARKYIANVPVCDEVFGRAATGAKADMGTGGKVEFHHAVHAKLRGQVLTSGDAKSAVDLEAHAVIDRRTGAAAEGLLHHLEMVPAETEFDVVITGENLSAEELECLLAGMAGFNHGSPEVRARLGAGTYDGRGRVEWKPTAIRRLDRTNIGNWIAGGACGYDGFADIDPGEFDTLTVEAQRRALAAESSGWVTIAISLEFDRAFLVSVEVESAKGEPDRVPMFAPDGRVLLPASSLRGPLRAQAERIARTCGIDACRPGNPCPTSTPCIVCRTFGATGWGTPILLDDFAANECATVQQVFCPHDRIVGGPAAAESGAGLLHTVKHAQTPVFPLEVSLDITRLIEGCGEEGLGLLAHTLADLCDGDIQFGYGFGKGYGACKAKVGGWRAGPNAGASDDAVAREQVARVATTFLNMTTGGDVHA